MSSPSVDGYGGQSTLVQPSPPKDLPFTGFDVGLIGVGGLLLVVVGACLRKAAHAPR